MDHGFLDSFSLDLGTSEWQAIEPGGWRVRQSDHAFLTSPRASEVLEAEGIQVVDYRPFQRAWAAAS